MKTYCLLTALLVSTVTASQAADHVEGVLDFSYCGYEASACPLPDVTARAVVKADTGDMTSALQAAIDYVASLPIDNNGRRGAVQLEAGTYSVSHTLHLSASGVVVRGAGMEATVIRREGVSRTPIFSVEGREETFMASDTCYLTAAVPLGAKWCVAAHHRLTRGATVEIVRQSTAPWIEHLNCHTFGGGIDALGWKAGDVDLYWPRVVERVSGDTLFLDAPLTMAFDPTEQVWYQGRKQKEKAEVPLSPAFVRTVSAGGVVSQCGVENLTLEAAFDPQEPTSEYHAWTGISLAAVHDAWVRQVRFLHLAGAGVVMQPTAQRITVEDCLYLDPAGENAGHRRTAFFIIGHQCLVQRCYARKARHAFAVGHSATGPNAFVQCEAEEALSYSGSVSPWVTGVLYDIVDIDGHDLVFKNLQGDVNGCGWNAAASVMYQSTAATLIAYSPDTVNVNVVCGGWGQFEGNARWQQSNNHVTPRSLFYAQLAARMGGECRVVPRLLPRGTEATSSPKVDEAQRLAAEARTTPRLTLCEWISAAPAPSTVLPRKGVKTFVRRETTRASSPLIYAVQHGYLTADRLLLTGYRYQTPWWNGNLRPSFLLSDRAKPALTRFVPDREGRGLTDRLDSVVAWMQRQHILVWDQNYGLWYDRRRDDHERMRRKDAAVWAPFWEQPWRRTGSGHAWNGLSLYNLSQNDPWYYYRLHRFAEKTAHTGQLLFLQHYFQHNILEAGAHYVDAPWRPVNNVNHTVFPEPVPFTGDKRIFMAEWFYDVNDTTMARLHKDYIIRNLKAFADVPNVVHSLSEEYTGPLSFMRFWVETIRDYAQQTGQHFLVALAATRDVQDSLLADPLLAPTIDIIDIRYWHYKSKPDPKARRNWDDGRDCYDPHGGLNLAPRQHARLQPVGAVRFSDAYRSVSEYRQRFPDKAVVYSALGCDTLGWAVLMAGGSCPALALHNTALQKAIPLMRPVGETTRTDAKVLQSSHCALVYGLTTTRLTLTDLPAGTYTIETLDPTTGQPLSQQTVSSSSAFPLTLPVSPSSIYFVHPDIKTERRITSAF